MGEWRAFTTLRVFWSLPLVPLFIAMRTSPIGELVCYILLELKPPRGSRRKIYTESGFLEPNFTRFYYKWLYIAPSWVPRGVKVAIGPSSLI